MNVIRFNRGIVITFVLKRNKLPQNQQTKFSLKSNSLPSGGRAGDGDLSRNHSSKKQFFSV